MLFALFILKQEIDKFNSTNVNMYERVREGGRKIFSSTEYAKG